jgi:tetratricopeptide (TPR) repeat protein
MKTGVWNETIAVKWIIILLVLSMGVGFFIGVRYADHVYLRLQRQRNIGGTSGRSLPEGHPDISKGVPETNPETIQTSIIGLEDLLKKDPGNLSLMIHLGNLYADNQQTEKAIKVYEKALKIEPNQPEVWVDCGVMQRDLKQLDKAENYFNRALSYDSTQAFAYYNLGVVYAYDRNQPPKAISYWKKLIQLHPETPIAMEARQQIIQLKSTKK